MDARVEYVAVTVRSVGLHAGQGYRVVCALRDDLMLMERPVRRPAFHAELKLLGHRDLGLCCVEESSLGGRDMLRVTPLDDGDAAVHWIAPASVYDLREVPEAEVERRLARITAEREREMRVQAERAERRQGTVATLECQGDQTRVTWRDAAGVEWRAWTEREVDTAVTECGHIAAVWSYRQGVEVGSHATVAIEALEHLGCKVGDVVVTPRRERAEDPLTDPDDCNQDDEDCDDRGPF